jgi:hypothetical protein
MDARAKAELLLNDLEFYARNCLHIRTKSGTVSPFTFNRAQRYIHDKLEEQRKTKGKVRALILKGRQQGCSTYVAARYYHHVTTSKGVRVFILTHEDPATQNLFEIVNRYHENCPEYVKPSTGAANAKELYFDQLDAGYKVGTAGTRAVGRSSTVQLFHGSEVGFWPHADQHAAGVLQAVPDLPGTEVILESTANGMADIGAFFYAKWRDAERGDGDFVPIFVPWYWQEEYHREVPPDFIMDEDEQEYKALYKLSDGQIAWRRNKITELKDASLFKQEYPATSAEAFQMSGHDSFIPAKLVAKARKATVNASGPLVIGYDPAHMGDDRHSMAWRQGRRVIRVVSRSKLNTMEGAGWAKQVIDEHKPARMFIDVGGVGAGVYDRLMEMGYGKVVRAVNFGSSPLEPARVDKDGKPLGGYLNRRAEMWGKSKDWLEEEPGVQLPDEDSIQADACGPTYKYDSLTRLQIEKKEDMRRRNVPSPDEWDAIALTFAEPVSPVMTNLPKPKTDWIV